MRALAVAAVAACGAALLGRGSSTPAAHGAQTIEPANFVRQITNPWLPWKPGSLWVYRGVKDGLVQKDTVRVLDGTKTILGVHCTVVSDVATHNGTVLEKTRDWYAQDRAGNVWYFGEATAEYSGGTVDRSGSWQAGVHGAQPGIVMKAQPQVDDAYRQEYWRGHAEDQYWLVDLHQHVTVPFGSFAGAALTLEWSRLEPFVIDRKTYVKGIGVVKEVAAEGPREVASLVRFHT
jgi:hypothetical protein